jgi:hypothetical protein
MRDYKVRSCRVGYLRVPNRCTALDFALAGFGCVYPVRGSGTSRCYTARVYGRKLKVEIVVDGERRPMPLDWLDSFCMRNFTGSAEFDDTLPVGDGRLEAGRHVDPTRLAQAMSDWFTKRGKGDGRPVVVEIQQAN